MIFPKAVMTTTKTIVMTSILAILAIGVPVGVFAYQDSTITTNQEISEPQMPSDEVVNFSASESIDKAKHMRIVAKAMTNTELNKIANGWEQTAVNYIGTIEPFSVDQIQVKMRLPEGTANTFGCDRLAASVTIDLETETVISDTIPKGKVDCNASVSLGRPSTQLDTTGIPSWIPTANAHFGTSTRAFHDATQESFNGKFGGFGFIEVPSIDDTEIFAGMDQFIGYVYNQDVNVNFLQIGWIVTAVNGEPGSGVSANNKYIVYVDEDENNNLEAHVTGLTWVEGEHASVYIKCQDNAYHIKMFHSSTWFDHPTGLACTNTVGGIHQDNGVFLENFNTTPSSGWADDITSVVKAWSMREYDTTTSYSSWDSSNNYEIICGTGSHTTTTDITGSLAGYGTATWSNIAGIPTC